MNYSEDERTSLALDTLNQLRRKTRKGTYRIPTLTSSSSKVIHSISNSHDQEHMLYISGEEDDDHAISARTPSEFK